MLTGCRRRPARRADEPVPLREGHRRDAGAVRQHQGPAGPVPQPDDAGRLRREVGPEPVHGDVASPTAPRSRSSKAIVANATGMRVRQARHDRPDRATGHVDRAGRALSTRRSCASAAASSTTWSAPARPGRVRAGHPRRSEAAPLPEPVQARRGAAVLLLHALPPVPLRGAEHGGARGAVPGRRAGAARAAAGRVVAAAKIDLKAGDDASTGSAAT